MGKTVGEILDDIAESDVNDKYSVHVLFVNRDDDGEIIGEHSTVGVVKIEIDHSSRELLLHKGKEAAILVSELREYCVKKVLSYDVCAAEEHWLDDDSYIRMDTPLVGLGQNHDEKRFFVVCNAED